MKSGLLPAVLYLLASAAWILLSDRVLLALLGEAAQITTWQSIKGLAFVSLSAFYIYWLATRESPSAELADGNQVESSLRRAFLLGALSFLLTLAAGAFLVQQIEAVRALERKRGAADMVEDHAHAIETYVGNALTATHALGALVRQGRGRVDDFETVGRDMLAFYGGVDALRLAPGGVIRQSVPLVGHENVIGVDLLRDPARRAEAEAIVRSRQLTITGPYELKTGGMGLVGRLPVFLPDASGVDRFWGFTIATLRLDALLSISGLDQMEGQGFNYTLAKLVGADQKQVAVFAHSRGELAGEAVLKDISLPNGRWRLAVTPAAGWYETGQSLIVEAALVLLVSGLVGVTVLIMLRQPGRLRREVDRRTRQLSDEVASHRATAARLAVLSQAIEQSPAAVVITDAGGRIEYVNPKFERLTGYTADEAVGQTPALIKSGLTPPEMYAEMWRTIKAGREWRGELLNRSRQGELFWEYEIISPLRDERGEIIRFLAVKEDITARKRAEADMHRLNRSLTLLSQCNHELVHAAGEAALLRSICGLIVTIGEYPLAWIGLRDPADAETVTVAAWSKADTEGEAVLFDADRAGSKGPVAQVMRCLEPVIQCDLGDAGQAGRRSRAALPLLVGEHSEGVLNVYTDEDDPFPPDEMRLLMELAGDLAYGLVSRRAEAARAESEARFRAINAAAQDAIVVMDHHGYVTYWNPAAERIFGHTAAEALGRDLHALITPERYRAAAYAGLETFSAHGEGAVVGKVVELSGLRRDGTEFPLELSVSAIWLKGEWSAVATIRDITERKRQEAELERQTYHDELTGLANHTLLLDRLGQALHYSERADRMAAAVLIDIDNFKLINDGLGRERGDAVLVELARRLEGLTREGDTVARLDGDEFVVVLADLAQEEDVAPIVDKVQASLAAPVALPDGPVVVAASMGVALYPRDGETAADLMGNAEVAMYRSKEAGGGVFRYFTPEMNVRARRSIDLAGALRQALERDEFLLHYQPKVDAATGRILGVEALVRWQRPGQGLISPAEFIPLAEDSGLIVPLGEWVLAEACRQLARWGGEDLPTIGVAVNLSARQFRLPDLKERINLIVSASGVDPRLIELEITESMIMQEPEAAVDLLRDLKRSGLSLALDDFGTGYSSLAYLKRFPIDCLKIDRSFVLDITSDPDSAAIANAVIALAHNLDLKVVAEGVETESQFAYLRARRCDQIQGYYFSRPLPADEIGKLLRQGALFGAATEVAGGLPERVLLLVDDEPHVLASLQRQLRREGYRILTAASAQEGFELLAKHPVQVIVSDQRMPEMSGTEFLSRVKDIHPDTIRIVLSGYTDLKSVTDAVNRGAIYKFLTKPWNENELREALREAFRRHERLEPGAGT